MKLHPVIFLSALTLVLLSSGCHPAGTTATAENATPVPAPLYSKKGLLLPEDTRKSLGVRLAEVTEQPVNATLELPLCVYQVGDGGVLTSSAITPEQARRLKAGQQVELIVTDGNKLTAKVTRLNDDAQRATGLTEVLVEIRPAPTAAKIGTFLQGRVQLRSGTSVVSIPRAALLQCSDGYSVYTVSGDHLVRTQVKVSAVNASLAEIDDGLYAGDQVVLEPVMSLWMTELAAVKGGQSCCVQPPKRK